MSKELTILDWATQFYCAADDHAMLEDLLPLRKCVASSSISRTQLSSDAMPQSKGKQADRGHSSTGQLDDDQQPLHIVFYKLRRALDDLGPAYLGLCETEEMLDSQQPWASPLNLQRMAKPTAAGISGTQLFKTPSTEGNSLEPFSSPFNSPSRPVPKNTSRMVGRAKARAAKALDIPEIIYLLITAENARRHYAAQFISKKHAEGSVGEQSERWQHHFAKRNIASETKFENILVALKELVVMRAIADLDLLQIGELKQVLGNIDAGQRRRSHGAPAQPKRIPTHCPDFDAAQCLAVLNLMFPLDPLHADSRYSLGTNKWQQRYAFPLQHVPNPRMQLHQLLCEAEAWINGDERVTASVGPVIHKNSTVLDQLSHSSDSDEPPQAKRIRLNEIHTPANCPTWLAAARGFAWGQLKQSCQAYLRDTQQKIQSQHYALHPWTPMSLKSPVTLLTGSSLTLNQAETAERLDSASSEPTAPASPPEQFGKIGAWAAEAILDSNKVLIDEVMKDVRPNTTVIQRIVQHSQLINMRFSRAAAYRVLGSKQQG
ncbi:hypothetical protein IWW54_004937 [Coemansia sp. RSA 2705]|nr:hypothetical protein IWW54_004937 [Coemansia sp. RSA 2705]